MDVETAMNCLWAEVARYNENSRVREAWQTLKAAVEIDNSAQQPQHKISTLPCKWGYAKCVFDVCFERCDTCKVTKTA